MPNHKSCKKRLQQSLRNREVGRQNRAFMRSELKAFRALGASEEEVKPESLSRIYSVLDRQASKGTIPRKRAARLKARAAALISK